MHSYDDYGHPLDEYGNRIRKTNRPPYIMPEDWYYVSEKRRKEATREYKELRNKWIELKKAQAKSGSGSSTSGLTKKEKTSDFCTVNLVSLTSIPCDPNF